LHGIPVNLRAVNPGEWGAGMLFLTGSQQFNIMMRAKAKKEDMILNRTGLYTRESKVKIAGRTEKSIFKMLGMDFVEPTAR